MKALRLRNKIISAVLTAATIFTTMAPAMTVHAYERPHAYWGVQPKYEAALKSADYNGIIKYGREIENIMSGEPDNSETVKILCTPLYEIAFAYYCTGDYASALEYFRKALPYMKKANSSDSIKICENFINQLTPTLDIYKFTPNEQVYYGAKNEPHGVLLGEVSESVKENDSMVLLYLEYGDTSSGTLGWAKQSLASAQNKGQTVELALNFPNQGDDARSIQASDDYLNTLKNLVSNYPNTPILLRIGAEVNIWENSCTPDEFKSAFKAIASVMRELPNVAIVWSVAHTASWDRTSSDFYPGDEWVDWVGVTAYPTKYFIGKRWQGKSAYNEAVFKTGYNADPVLEVQEIIEEFGGRKPIMISECGSAYYTGGEINEEYTDWGVEQLQNMYALIPMVYPQVKLMAYFNTRVPDEINYYDYRNNPALNDAYMNIKTSSWFIKGESANSAETYFEKVYSTLNAGSRVTVGAYPRLYGSDTITVDYYIDGKWAASSNKAPYQATLTVPDGNHTLNVVATGNNGAVEEKAYELLGAGGVAGAAPAPSATISPASKGDKDNAYELSDISSLSQTQRAAIETATKRGIVSGYDDNTFRPENTITRAEFATIMCRAMGYPADSACDFIDAADHWSTNYIDACVDAGVISGVGNNRFAPDDNVTLEQAVKIVTIAQNMATPDTFYPDGYLVAGYAYGIMDNLTSFEYSGPLNRIDAAMIITQAIS